MSRRRRSASIGLAILAAATCYVGSSTAAFATSVHPTVPTGVHVVAFSSTSLRVAAHRSANTTRYKLFTSTVQNDLYVYNLGRVRSTRRSAWSSKPDVTVTRLKYAAVPYYFRFAATNGSHLRVSNIGTVNLRPSAPTSVRLVSGTGGMYLTWSSVAATGFTIAQSTDAAMRVQRHDYVIRGQATQFTPYGLAKGTTYYFRVRAINGSTRSGYSVQSFAPALTSEQSVRVMTYNVLAAGLDGRATTGEVVASWNTRRKAAAAALIVRGDPDVIAIEEGASWTAGYRGPRQVDTLRSALGSTYSLASTEVPPSQPNFLRTGDYIIYRNTTYQAVGAGGHWSIGDGLFGVYQVLRNRASGATFMFVATHLRAGVSSSLDRLRESLTRNVVTGARRIAAQAGGLPIIYGGDFNSHLSHYHPFDGPSRVTLPAGISEADYAAQSRSNVQYNSDNRYLRAAPKGLGSIDRIFAEPGIALRSWTQLLRLSGGRFIGAIPSDHNPVLADARVPY